MSQQFSFGIVCCWNQAQCLFFKIRNSLFPRVDQEMFVKIILVLKRTEECSKGFLYSDTDKHTNGNAMWKMGNFHIQRMNYLPAMSKRWDEDINPWNLKRYILRNKDTYYPFHILIYDSMNLVVQTKYI